mgnify:CR=1 FL=1
MCFGIKINGNITIKDNVNIGGQAGLRDNITVGNNEMIGAQSGVLTDVPDGSILWGTPSKSLIQTKREVIVLGWLTQNFLRIKRLLKGKV